LNALVIGEEGVEISGKVNADNVEGLGSWIVTNRDTVSGLYPTEDATKLKGIEAGAEVNFIKSVNTDEFTVNDDGLLTINKISVNNIANLDSKLPGFTKVSNDFVIEEDTLKLTKTYLESSVYLAEVGDLTQLIHAKKENSTIVDEINFINERLQWADLI
jgi:hypothetical protein